ncbi:hypothetical protein M0R45_016007 [Rubus argutus]|uniref:Uncharacterized protein n=1 Tax=Rubus argutus TaxID=59490 RepID=A0AAW1XRE1_RUBAR
MPKVFNFFNQASICLQFVLDLQLTCLTFPPRVPSLPCLHKDRTSLQHHKQSSHPTEMTALKSQFELSSGSNFHLQFYYPYPSNYSSHHGFFSTTNPLQFQINHGFSVHLAGNTIEPVLNCSTRFNFGISSSSIHHLEAMSSL